MYSGETRERRRGRDRRRGRKRRGEEEEGI